jgi:hypothetical protein
MPAKSLTAFTSNDPLHKKIRTKLNGIKKGYFYLASDFTQELGFTATVLRAWYVRYPEMLNYRCFIKQGQARKAVFVHPQFKHQLIVTGKATENY